MPMADIECNPQTRSRLKMIYASDDGSDRADKALDEEIREMRESRAWRTGKEWVGLDNVAGRDKTPTRLSPATLRAIERVRNGEGKVSAALAEGISPSTIFRALAKEKPQRVTAVRYSLHAWSR